jgi:hypothetical protein
MKRSGLDGIMGKEVLGILGFDFINRFTIEVDYQHNKLTLFDKKEYEYKGDGKSIPITITDTRPLVKGNVINTGKEFEGTWLIDTGRLMFIGLQKSCVEDNKVDGFKFHDYVFENCFAGYSEDPVLASFPFDGVLGGEFFRRFTVVIDYEKSRLICEPNLGLYDPVVLDRSGMILIAKGDDFEVIEIAFVHERSPGAVAGIERGDELVEINGMAAS